MLQGMEKWSMWIALVAAVAALMSAQYWLRSTRVKWPPVLVVVEASGQVPGDPLVVPLAEFHQAMSETSTLNRRGAIYAAAAAFLTAIAIALQAVES